MARLLIIDDEEKILKLLQQLFTEQGHEVLVAPSASIARQVAATEEIDLVFSDVRLPDGNGLELLPALIASPGRPEVVIMTGYGDPDGAELAISSGAWDYLQKPCSIGQFLFSLEKALEYRSHKLLAGGDKRLARGGMVGESQVMRQCLATLAEAAGTDLSVLVTGETGTGKELVAKILHQNSARSEGPFVVVDCTSLPEKLVEGMLFGHVRGAFTGAERSNVGLVKQADGGTLFLDEIGELPLELQSRLLRVLQEKAFRPVGSSREETSDFRLVAATNRDLEAMISRGEFRQDLYFRMSSFTVELPPLRERMDDVESIAQDHVEKLCRQSGIRPKVISQDLAAALMHYDWPGNVRELLNVLDVAFHRAGTSPNLYAMHLPVEFRTRLARMQIHDGKWEAEPVANSGDLSSFSEHRKYNIELIEKSYMEDLIVESGGDLRKAMNISGLGKTRLYNLLKKHGLSLRP